MSARIRPIICSAGLAAVLITGVSACSGTNTDASSANTHAKAPSRTAAAATVKPSNTVKLSSSPLGRILTDDNGRTLYAFTNDKDAASGCTDQCIATWPALTLRGGPAAGTGITPSLLGTTQRAQGATQATYNNWPLYYYVGDTSAGDVSGEGIDGAWSALSATGKLIHTAP
jgi:predicted lipoprotein with Yx(FWY)xxD motif